MNLSSADPSNPGGAPDRGLPARRIFFLHWLIVLLVAVLETRVMWAPALLAGHSAWFDLTRMVVFDAAIRAGDYLPIWSPEFYFGYGSPLFQFYAPLAYYLAELALLAGADLPTALKITQLVALIVSGLAMYQLAARHLSRWAACFGAILYMVAPYRIVDMFVRHALAEHCAFLWLPLIVLGTERFVSERSRTGLLTGLLATAGLILTHNIMALIGLPVCVAAGWVLSARRPLPSSPLLAGGPALLGVGLSAFFWWPALSGRAFTRAEESLTGGYFAYHRHFVEARQFADFAWGFGESGAQAAEKMSLQIGLPHLLFSLGAIFALVWQARRKTEMDRWAVLAISITVGAAFMCHELSRVVWANLPLVQYVQFPWRFLGLVVFGTAMSGAAVANLIGKTTPRLERPLFLLGLIFVMAAYFPYYSEARFLVVDTRTNSLTPVAPRRLEALESAGVAIPAAGLVTLESIRAVGDRATSSDDFLPRGVEEKPTSPPAEALAVAGGRLRRFHRVSQNRYQAEVSMSEAGRVELRQFWFPSWTASVDGRSVPATPFGKSAVVNCAVPAGDHVVGFQYEGLPQRRAGLAVSLASLAVAALAVGWFSVRQKGGAP